MQFIFIKIHIATHVLTMYTYMLTTYCIWLLTTCLELQRPCRYHYASEQQEFQHRQEMEILDQVESEDFAWFKNVDVY